MSIELIHRAESAYLDVALGEKALAALSEAARLMRERIAASKTAYRDLTNANQAIRPLVEDRVNALIEAGVVSTDSVVASVLGIAAPVPVPAAVPAPATADAAASRRSASRKTRDDGPAHIDFDRRLEILEQGFYAGYTAGRNNTGQQNPYTKGDRYQGWRLGFEQGAKDAREGVTIAGNPPITANILRDYHSTLGKNSLHIKPIVATLIKKREREEAKTSPKDDEAARAAQAKANVAAAADPLDIEIQDQPIPTAADDAFLEDTRNGLDDPDNEFKI